LAKSKIAVILAILIVGGIAGYFFWHDYALGIVTLRISDPPQPQNGNTQQYDPSILHIYITFTEIDVHQARFGGTNSTGWYALLRSPTTVDMLSVLDAPRTLATTNLASGSYDQVRFPVSTAIVTFSSTGNVSYTIPSSALRVSITGAGFQSSPGARINLQLTISFSDSEILSMNGYLTPHASAQVVG
jgi:Domain of unknown function (DUF4382)